MKILVADDNPINQMVAESFLSALGYECQVVSDGREVISLLNTEPYDVIFMDIQMPDLGGCETSRLVREKAGDQPYIIAMSAHEESEILTMVRDFGMDDYIAKPVKKKTIQEAIGRYLSSCSSCVAEA